MNNEDWSIKHTAVDKGLKSGVTDAEDRGMFDG